MVEAIPLADAIRLCEATATESRAHPWRPSSWQCLGCVQFSADVEHRCFAAQDNRGCPHVNAAWARERAARGPR
jgi:hypothetical protein